MSFRAEGVVCFTRNSVPEPKGHPMKAVVIHAPRDLRVEERDAPEPGPGEVAVAIRAGGICGSDLHYYAHGGFGTVRVVDPMVLGHEAAGEIAALGPGVEGLAVGDRVAVNPSLPCGSCEYCLRGETVHCLDMRFLGSAMRRPHVDGAFREIMVTEAARCVTVPDTVSFAEAAFAEPLAVVLAALGKAGPLIGKRVHVAGCGPIGALAVLAARGAGAGQIVVTDLADAPLATGRTVGADRAVNVAADPDAMAPYAERKGYFDVVFEATGSEAAFRAALQVARPGGTIVQLGLGGDIAVPQTVVVAKELTVRGTFRFHREFAVAARMIAEGKLDVTPLLTETLPVNRAEEAFALAGDRSRAMKVHLAFGG